MIEWLRYVVEVCIAIVSKVWTVEAAFKSTKNWRSRKWWTTEVHHLLLGVKGLHTIYQSLFRALSPLLQTLERPNLVRWLTSMHWYYLAIVVTLRVLSLSITPRTTKRGKMVDKDELILPCWCDNVTIIRVRDELVWLYLHFYKPYYNQILQKGIPPCNDFTF